MAEPSLWTKYFNKIGDLTAQEIAEPDLATAIKNDRTQIADNKNQEFNMFNNDMQNILTRYFDFIWQDINIVFLGDSISQGIGASTVDNSYLSKLFNKIKLVTNHGKGSGYEVNANFEAPPEGFTYTGSYSIGSSGAVKKSIILQPGATISFSRACDYIAIFYNQTTSAGSIQLSKNGIIISSINCSGTTQNDKDNIDNMWQMDSAEECTYTLTCLNATVELTAVCTWVKAKTKGNIYFNRFAVSGTATGDYIDTNTLQSIVNIGTWNKRIPTIFIIALGTNDIYNSSKAVSSTVYKQNLNTIATYLLNAGYWVSFQVPLIPIETIQPILEPHENYRKAVYDKSNQLEVPLLDLSLAKFNSSLYADGLHPNDAGHYKLAQIWANFLRIPKNTSLSIETLVVELTNFVDDSGNKKYENANLNNISIIGVYIKNKTNDVVVPYRDYIDYSNNIGLVIVKAYSNSNFKIYYNPTGGFCKINGLLSSFLTNTPSEAQLIIEYIP